MPASKMTATEMLRGSRGHQYRATFRKALSEVFPEQNKKRLAPASLTSPADPTPPAE